MENNQKLRVLSLFSGAGGMDLGFIQAGYEIVYANDFDKEAVETYRANIGNHIECKEVSEIKKDELPEEIDVVIGGPPCQGFSMAGNVGRKFSDDPRNQLYKEFSKIIGWIKPKYFVMENVARLYTHNHSKTRFEILEDFSKNGYNVEAKILNSANYGVPQIRNRVIFIGVRSDIITKIEFPISIYNENQFKTIEESIDHFPALNSGEICSQYINHEAMQHTQQMLDKMFFIKDGGTRDDIPEELRPQSGDIRKYIRYASKKPSICITGDMRKVFHYSQNRALTVRELASIQTFPDDFEFKGSKISQQQQVGNAVPVLMAYEIARSIIEMDKKKNKKLEKSNKKFPKINYIGNKEKIVEWIIGNVPEDVKSVVDAFSGGCSVSYALKSRGYSVIANDVLKINFSIAEALIENKNEILTEDDLSIIFSGNPLEGFAYDNYKNKYYYEDECKEIDLYMNNIQKMENKYKKSLAIILLRRALIRKMPYSRFNIGWEKIVQLRDEDYSYKKYKRKRAYHNQSIKDHFIENLKEYNECIFDNEKLNKAMNKDIFDLLEDSSVKADLIYLDPPYSGTLNDYHGFYSFLDELILQKKIEPFENNFRNKKESVILFEKLISSLNKFKYCILSYHEKAYPTKEILKEILEKNYEDVKIISKTHNYQVTGKENKNVGKELLFIAKGFKNI